MRSDKDHSETRKSKPCSVIRVSGVPVEQDQSEGVNQREEACQRDFSGTLHSPHCTEDSLEVNAANICIHPVALKPQLIVF